MAIFAATADVPVHTVDMRTTSFATRLVYGSQTSLMVATRPGGYHSSPHVHNCEQINYMASGELWIFVEQRPYLLRTGDFLRIPPGVVHWSWNQTDHDCILIEVHAPGLQDDPVIRAAAVPLFGDGESSQTTGSPRNEFVEYDPAPAEALATGPSRPPT